jgi:hypothetical protein
MLRHCFAYPADQPLLLAEHERAKELVFVVEIAVDGLSGEPGFARDVGHGGAFCPESSDANEGGVEDLRPGDLVGPEIVSHRV